MQSQKRQNYLGLFRRQTIQQHSNPSLCPTTNVEDQVEGLCEDLQDLLELTSKKGVLFIIKGWNAKDGGQKIPGVTGKMVLEYKILNREKANRVLPRECTGHSKHPLPTTQEKTRHITRWSTLRSD